MTFESIGGDRGFEKPLGECKAEVFEAGPQCLPVRDVAGNERRCHDIGDKLQGHFFRQAKIAAGIHGADLQCDGIRAQFAIAGRKARRSKG